MKYVVLVFENGPNHPTTGEDPARYFLRRWVDHRSMRDMVGAVSAITVDLTPEEESNVEHIRTAVDGD